MLVATPMIVAAVPMAADRQAVRAVVGEKDDHVVAAGLAVAAPFLLTLDRRLARAVNAARLSIRAFGPGEFILGVLPAHEEFERLRL